MITPWSGSSGDENRAPTGSAFPTEEPRGNNTGLIDPALLQVAATAYHGDFPHQPSHRTPTTMPLAYPSLSLMDNKSGTETRTYSYASQGSYATAISRDSGFFEPNSSRWYKSGVSGPSRDSAIDIDYTPKSYFSPYATSVSGDSAANVTYVPNSSSSYALELSKDSAYDVEGPIQVSPGQYSCPFRKRNPRRFNICDSKSCTLDSFHAISEVKQHIVRYHISKRFSYRCRVCCSLFQSVVDLDNHHKAQACSNVPSTVSDYERGVSGAILATLQDPRVNTWDHLWRVIFPDCDPMPPDFVPPRLDYQQADASTQTCPEESNQCPMAKERRPSSSLQGQHGTPDSQTQPAVLCETTIPGTNSALQQVGLARVHIEILSLSEQHQRWRRDETDSLDGSDSDTDSKYSEDDVSSSEAQDSDGSSGDTSTGVTPTVDNANQQESAPAAGQPTLPLKRNRPDGGEDDNNGNDRKRQRPRRRPQGAEPVRQRFACPYQAADRSLNCFMPSRRNPSGGCDSISRLKDHMTRKHMVSYRCQRCWKHFNARRKAQTHPQSNCLEKNPPNYERFMTEAEEIEVENCAGMQPEDTWWKLFQLLIPDMSEQDLSQLKILYSPYYRYYIDTSLTFPSMTLPTISFEPSHTHSSGLGSPSDAFFGLGNTSLVSQSIPVPIFATPMPQPNPLPPFDGLGLQSTSGSITQRSDSTTQSDRINALPTPASSSPDTSQIQRNYERLKLRASQTDTENGELRATISSVREEVRNAGTLLEDVLGMDNVEGEIYDRLSRVAEMLISVTGRLR